MAGIFLDFRVRSIWWRRSLSWPLAMPGTSGRKGQSFLANSAAGDVGSPTLPERLLGSDS
jgi:hypothetical protein